MRKKFRDLFRSGNLSLALLLLFAAVVTFFQFQTSVSRIPFLNSEMTATVFAWNLTCYCLLLVLLAGIFGKVHYAVFFWSIFAFGVSIANYYILMFHGAPLTVHILHNAGTALDVIDSYRFSVDLYSGVIILGFASCMAGAFLAYKIGKKRGSVTSFRKRLMIVTVSLSLLAGNIYVGIFSDHAIKPRNSIVFSWASSAGTYGFLPLQLETHFQENTYTLSYDQYSEDTVYALCDTESEEIEPASVAQLPDIILILNECLFDLNQVADIETNIHPLAYYYSLENCVKGYAVGSGEGGGTNRSEYELLTSISTSLLPNQTPFLAMDVAGQCSVVSYLETMGYTTYGAHCAKSANYNRKYSYSAMGFDKSFFDLDFEGLEYYGNRANTDASAYKNLIKWYEEPTEQPKFMYLLTYQNHGGWEQNPEELDTVFVQNDFGEYTGQMNEYLSSVRLSDIELANLLEYFQNVDKPVFVCILGDHGPSFARNIADPSISEEELTYRIKGTPLLIWSNYGLESEDLGYVSLNYVVPKLMETAGIPLSPFYSYQLKILQEAPVIMSYNSYYNSNMDMIFNTDDTFATEKIQNYFTLCINNIQENRYPPLFEPVR